MVNHIKGSVHPLVFTPFLRFLEFAFPSLAHCAKNENIWGFFDYISLYTVLQKCNK